MPRNRPRSGLGKALLLVVLDGVGVALVEEIGAGIREFLQDRREAARPRQESDNSNAP